MLSELSYWKLLTRRKPAATIANDGGLTLAARSVIMAQPTPPQLQPPPPSSSSIQVSKSSSNYKKPPVVNMNRIDIGSTLGIGVFIIIGFVTRDIAGPSVIISFIVATAVALLAGLFYAELSNRIPIKSYSSYAYNYSYLCIGEWAAFIIGWNLILEYIIGIAVITKTIGLHIDLLVNDTIKMSLSQYCPIDTDLLSNYFDFLGFGITIIILFVVILIAHKRSEFINKILLLISIAVILFIIIAGAFKGNTSNWTALEQFNQSDIGGTFIPFGGFGIIEGTAICLFIFIGIDHVTNSKTNNRSIFGLLTFLLAFIFILAACIILTLLLPYYEQDKYAPFPQNFNEIGWITAQWIISISGIFVMFASLFGMIYPMLRLIHDMAKDELIFRIALKKSMNREIIAVTVSMIISAMFVGLFNQVQLISFLSIGTIIAFFMTSLVVINLRTADDSFERSSISTIDIAETKIGNGTTESSVIKSMAKIFSCKRKQKPSAASYNAVCCILILFCLTSLAFGLVIKFAIDNIFNIETWSICVTVILLVMSILLIVLLSMQPMHKYYYGYTVQCVPLIPSISIFLNIFLCLWLPVYAWIRFAIWTIIGIIIYFVCAYKYNRRRPNILERYKPYGLDVGLVNNGFVNDSETYHSTTMSTERSIFGNEMKEKDSSLSYDDTLKYQEESIETPMENLTALIVHEEESEPKLIANNQLNQKANTPSPSTSLDDICLCSEVENSLTEKREPNGKTYFIDGGNSNHDIDEQNLIDDMDQKRVIALLDDVLNTEESSDQKSRKSSIIGEMEKSSVVAIIHISSSGDESDSNDVATDKIAKRKSEINESVSKTQENEMIESCVEEIKIHQNSGIYSDPESVGTKSNIEIIEAFNKYENENSHTDTPESIQGEVKLPLQLDENSNSNKIEAVENINEIESFQSSTNESETTKKNDEIETTSTQKESETSKKVNEVETILPFKDRLALLLNQQSQSIKKSYEPLSAETKSPSTTGLIHAKSETDIMKLVHSDIRARKVDIDIDHNATDHDIGSMTLPRTQLQSLNDNEHVIPPAPKFDPIVYKTIGSKVNPRKSPIRPTLGNAMSLDRSVIALKASNTVDGKSSSTDTKTEDKTNDNDDDDSTDEKGRMVKLRNKLENILKRGPPPNRYSRPPSLPPSPIPPTESIPLEKNEEVFNFKEAIKPYDTVHKQKLRFDDVLKSMSSDTRPSLLRATSPNRLTAPTSPL